MGKGEIIGTATFALLLGLVFFGEPGPYTHTTDTAPPWARPQVMHDLGSIRRDTLRVLVLRDPLSWEERPGAQTGLEWDLLRRFAKREHLAIKAVPVDDPDTMLLLLQQVQLPVHLLPCWALPPACSGLRLLAAASPWLPGCFECQHPLPAMHLLCRWWRCATADAFAVHDG